MSDIYGALGFYPQAPVEQLREVFNAIILPAMRAGSSTVKKLVHSQALFLETITYEILVKSSETEESFTYAYERMGPFLTDIGAMAAITTPWAMPGPRPHVAFWLPGTAILAHTQQLLTLLYALKDMGAAAPIHPMVYFGAPTNAETQKVFLASGADVRFLGDHARPQHMLPPMDLMERLRDATRRDGVQALVFVSTPVHLLTAVAMQVAPVILWWSMKWYNLAVPGLDERMTPRRGTSLEIGGYTWRCGHVCLPMLVDESKREMRKRLRDRYKIGDDQVAIGWMGREEKLTPAYGDAVATLLEANPHTIFVYTGRGRIPAFEDRLRSVASRVRFIGWVDVANTIWTLDIYADSFPMGSGHTAFAAMQAGIPVVTLMTEDNEKNSAAAHVMQLWRNAGDELTEDEHAAAQQILGTEDDELMVPGVYSLDEWHYELCGLAQNAQLRKDRGEVQKKFVQRFLMDAPRYAAQTSQIILETIAKKRGVPVESLALPAPAAIENLVSAPYPAEDTSDVQELRQEQTDSGGLDAAGAECGGRVAEQAEGSAPGRAGEAGGS